MNKRIFSLGIVTCVLLAHPFAANALQCTEIPKCTDMGYKPKTEIGTCSSSKLLSCPFDTDYQICLDAEYNRGDCPEGAICDAKYKITDCRSGWKKKLGEEDCECNLGDRLTETEKNECDAGFKFHKCEMLAGDRYQPIECPRGYLEADTDKLKSAALSHVTCGDMYCVNLEDLYRIGSEEYYYWGSIPGAVFEEVNDKYAYLKETGCMGNISNNVGKYTRYVYKGEKNNSGELIGYLTYKCDTPPLGGRLSCKKNEDLVIGASDCKYNWLDENLATCNFDSTISGTNSDYDPPDCLGSSSIELLGTNLPGAGGGL